MKQLTRIRFTYVLIEDMNSFFPFIDLQPPQVTVILPFTHCSIRELVVVLMRCEVWSSLTTMHMKSKYKSLVAAPLVSRGYEGR